MPDAARGIFRAPRFSGVPSMNIDLEVEVLWGVGRNDPSEPQGADREGSAEGSGERDLWGDVQEPDMRQGEIRASGPLTAKLSRPRKRFVDPALVQGQPMILTWGDLTSLLKGRRGVGR